MNRRNVIPLLENYEPEPIAKVPAGKQNDQGAASPEQPPPLRWAYFVFSSMSLNGLKVLATKEVPEGNFVSTDDVLSAFTWQAISRARAARFADSSLKSTLSRNVDMRHNFSLPASYPGLLVTSTVNQKPLVELAEESLGELASQLRAKLDPIKLKHQIQVQATRINQGDSNEYSFAATSDARLDVRLSSWVKETCHDLDFGGLLRKPATVRRPSFIDGAREGLVYFLPKSRDGEIAVGICLREDDMNSLMSDSLMLEHSRYIG
jgi:hypothetical protein